MASPPWLASERSGQIGFHPIRQSSLLIPRPSSCLCCAHRYEGDNYVLVQQVVRAALKAFQAVISSPDPAKAAKSLPPSTYFLRLLPELTSTRTATSMPMWSVAEAIHLLELRAAHMIQEHASRLKTGTPDGSADWRVARAVTEAFVAPRIGEVIVQVEKKLRSPSATVVVAVMQLVSLSGAEELNPYRTRSIFSLLLRLPLWTCCRSISSHAQPPTRQTPTRQGVTPPAAFVPLSLF